MPDQPTPDVGQRASAATTEVNLRTGLRSQSSASKETPATIPNSEPVDPDGVQSEPAGESLSPGNYEEHSDSTSAYSHPDGTATAGSALLRGAERIRFDVSAECDSTSAQCLVTVSMANTAGRPVTLPEGLTVVITRVSSDGVEESFVLKDDSIGSLGPDARHATTLPFALTEPGMYTFEGHLLLEISS